MEIYIILGGWTRSSTSYRKLIELTPKDSKTYFISYRELNHFDFAKSILDYLDLKKLKKVTFIGHSLGGAIAIDFTYKYPKRVKKLILVNSEGIFGAESLPKMFANFVATHAHFGRKKALENLRSVFRTIKNPLIQARLGRLAYSANMRDEAKKITVATTILWGEKDKLTPLWQGQELSALIENSKLKVILGMDHDWLLHSPGIFWENVL